MSLTKITTEKVRVLHESVKKHATNAVTAALECGVLLLRAHAECHQGEWELFLEAATVNKATAWRYMKIAEAYDPREAQLGDGVTLTMLYRELGLIRPLAGGGYRSDKYQDRKRAKALGLDQQEFIFSFADCTMQLAGLVGTDKVEKLAESSLVELEQNLESALNKVREVKANRKAVEVEA